MSFNISYRFTYEEKMVPRIIKDIYVDDILTDSSILDIPTEYESLPLQTLKDFSEFLTGNFNYLISIIINENLNQYKFSELIEPLKFICRTKTGCDEIIKKLENPEENTQPYVPVGDPVDAFLNVFTEFPSDGNVENIIKE